MKAVLELFEMPKSCMDCLKEDIGGREMKLSDVEILKFKRFAQLSKSNACIDIVIEDLEKLISTIEAQQQEIEQLNREKESTLKQMNELLKEWETGKYMHNLADAEALAKAKEALAAIEKIGGQEDGV